MKFRQFKIGITADIEKMFRQVLVNEKDRKYQRIWWRYNQEDPLSEYELNTVTYGHACAPHCAVRALIQCAIDHEYKFPMAAKLVKTRFYVDDLLTGADTFDQANIIKSEVTSLLKLGGFPITKWRTNGTTREHFEFRETDHPSVLGLFWNLSSDTFFYKINDIEVSDSFWTKRKILSKVGKLYDPNGYLGPVIMNGKLIIQDLWRDKMDWDDKIDGKIKENWEKFNKDLKNIHLITINRWLGTSKDDRMQLHGFCDASEKGYGVVIYSRVRDSDHFKTELIVSKSRVAPLKPTTMPRLELCAANLLANLIKVLIEIFKGDREKPKIFCWSDSQIVLHWLRKPSISLKTYVANRVANIQEISNQFDMHWNWIMGGNNPADLISRGSSIIELSTQ